MAKEVNVVYVTQRDIYEVIKSQDSIKLESFKVQFDDSLKGDFQATLKETRNTVNQIFSELDEFLAKRGI